MIKRCLVPTLWEMLNFLLIWSSHASGCKTCGPCAGSRWTRRRWMTTWTTSRSPWTWRWCTWSWTTGNTSVHRSTDLFIFFLLNFFMRIAHTAQVIRFIYLFLLYFFMCTGQQIYLSFFSAIFFHVHRSTDLFLFFSAIFFMCTGQKIFYLFSAVFFHVHRSTDSFTFFCYIFHGIRVSSPICLLFGYDPLFQGCWLLVDRIRILLM